jgi:phosphatidylglycerophosphate synthase
MSTPTSRPSVAELRAVAQPVSILGRSAHEHWSGLLYMRRISVHFTRLLIPTRVTPDQLTAGMGVAGIAAALVVTIPALWAALVGFLLLQVQLLLDCSDGELARWRGPKGGALGVYLDGLSHWTTDALLLVAVGVRADGGLGSIGGWTTLGLVAAVLALFVHAETDLVYVARAKSGLPPPQTDAGAIVPQVGLVRRLRRFLTRLPVNKLLSAWDLSYAIVVVAVIDAFASGLPATRVLTIALVAIGVYAAAGHLLSVLTSRRLR